MQQSMRTFQSTSSVGALSTASATTHDSVPDDATPSKRWTRRDIIRVVCLCLFGALTLSVVVMAFIPHSAVQRFLEAFLTWIEGLNFWASAELIIVTYAVGLLFMLPGTPWNLAAGYLFGIWFGTLFALIGANLGACNAFILGRTVVRDWAARAMRERPMLHALDAAIDDHGFKLVLLTRLSPLLPFPLLNFLFGVTRISLLHYSLATFLGLLPLTTAYCWIGSELRSLKDVLSSSGKNPVERYVWLGGAVGGTLLVTVVVTLITRNAINAALAKKMDQTIEVPIEPDAEAERRPLIA